MDENYMALYRRRLNGDLESLCRLDREGDGWSLMPTYLHWDSGTEIQIFVRPLNDRENNFEFSDLGDTTQRLRQFYGVEELPEDILPNPDYVTYKDRAFFASTSGRTTIFHAYHRMLNVISIMMGFGYANRRKARQDVHEV
jgi:hypothetical protein